MKTKYIAPVIELMWFDEEDIETQTVISCTGYASEQLDQAMRGNSNIEIKINSVNSLIK